MMNLSEKNGTQMTQILKITADQLRSTKIVNYFTRASSQPRLNSLIIFPIRTLKEN